MARRLSDITLSNFSAFLAKEMGLLFPKERWGDLETGLVSASRQFGFSDLDECVRWLMSAPLTRGQVETLAGYLTIGETYFFRDPRTLEILETEILPALLRSRRGNDQRLRIWSAACSTGEEPYTLAILLHRMIPDIKAWHITILATDINASSLRKGISGVYNKWSFRATPSWFKTLYFTEEEEGSLRVAEKIRRMVSFQYLNLAEDSYPSLPTNTNAMDLIFCRNVLMYFSPEMARTVAGKLQKSLVEHGWLFLGPAESLPRSFLPLEPVSLGGIVCYRKRGGTVTEQQAAPPEAPVDDRLAAAQQLPAPPLPSAGAREEEESAPTAKAGEGAAVSSLESAAVLYRQGFYSQAAAILVKLRSGGQLPPQALALLIRAKANQGDLDEALAICDEALKRDKLNPGLHYLRAEILQEEGGGEEARLSLQRALYLDPKLVLAHFALGNLTLWSGKPGRACKHFDNALALLESLDPDAIVPGSEGMTAGRLREMIRSMTSCAGRTEGRRP